ncbi:MAG: flagellar biosynthesis anti-sigma factor FlgM [Firmicutes bacterium]|nr:flagellar biosynthesis anti-sigma factor FlgM [Bacillota bacterium]
MKVSHGQVHEAAQAYLRELQRAARREGGPAPAGAPPQDGVVLSRDAKEARRWLDRLAALPDLDPSRLADLKQRVADGTYAPDASAIADQILARSLADRLAGGRA